MRLWSDAWAEMVPFLAFDTEIRKVDANQQWDRPTAQRVGRADPCSETARNEAGGLVVMKIRHRGALATQ